MTWEQMKNLDAGKKFHSEYEGVRIPLFEEVLRQFAGKVVMNIHIKSIPFLFCSLSGEGR